MASKGLRGLTIEIGADVTELNKALDKVDKRSRSLSAELGQINKALKLDPTNTELLAQKQAVLADAISNTEDKLNTLKEAEKQVQAQFERGEVSQEQVRALRREIIETEAKLDKYKSAAKDTADAVDNLGNEADEAAHELDEQADKTEEADRASGDLDDTVDNLAKGALTALVAAAAAATAAIVAAAEESREYRTEMAKLNTAFENVGFSAEAATETYEELQSILGETAQAVEASNMLARLCTTEEELAEWTEILTGVYGTFGTSLPVEGLAEAANETAKVGQVTGPLADALNWAAAENETFGVTLKENIEFTELEKKELDKLTDAQRAEYEATKKQYEEIEAYNKKVNEAVSAEDKFNIALENCTSEQERQQLITETLTDLYGLAAEQYKRTNKEVIRANEATEKWNKATAKLGKTVEPVITDFKELGVTLLEDAEEPLEDIADYIRSDVIPAIKKVGKWVKENGPMIASTLVGVTTAFVAYKIAVVAAEVAHKGLKGAIMATTVAEKALALAQAATPWGLVAVGITGLTAALVSYRDATDTSKNVVVELTAEERELIETANEAAEAFREYQEATQESMATIDTEMENVRKMADELLGLADASGQVEEKDRARAEFLAGELNAALGTEIELVDGVIQKYDELEQSIYDLIDAKLVNALLDEAQADYIQAQKERAAALEAANLAEKDYWAQWDVYQAKIIESGENWAKYEEILATGASSAAASYAEIAAAADEEAAVAKEALDQKKAAWDTATTNFANYSDTIIDYETAQQMAIEGNYEAAKKVLLSKGAAFGDYGDMVDEETAKVLDNLQLEAIQAGRKAELFRRNFEAGVDGYTEDMVKEAEEAYAETLDEFSTAYADAHLVGEDLGAGLEEGMESKRSTLYSKASSIVTGILKSMRTTADSHSPSRKTIAFGEDVGEGAEIGIENKTKDVKKAATSQAEAILEA